MYKDEIKSIIEAILFVWSDPISIKELGNIIQVDQREIKAAMEELKNEYHFNKRGIQVIQMNDQYQFATNPAYYEYIQKLFEPRQSKGLTQAALETLAIIAYRQPITKVEIEEIRGVKCDKALASLLEKDLIEERGRLEKTGRPILYGTTTTFLKVFDLKGLQDLPSVSEFELIGEEEEKIKNIFSK